jgi:hypothetical protein
MPYPAEQPRRCDAGSLGRGVTATAVKAPSGTPGEISMSRTNYKEALPSQDHAEVLLGRLLADGEIIEGEKPEIEKYEGTLPNEEDNELLKLWRITIVGS